MKQNEWNYQSFFQSYRGIILLAMALLTSVLCALRFGSTSLSTADFWGALLWQKDGTEALILYSVRLPRVLAGLLAGVGLSLSGVLLQSVTENELASPNIVGVNSGAGFGVIICLSLVGAWRGWQLFSAISLFAFLGATGTAILVLFLAERAGGGKVSVVLSGVAVTALLNALISAMTLLDSDILSSYHSFSVGGFDGVRLADLAVPALMVAVCFLIAMVQAPRLQLLCLGREMASVMGVRVRRLRVLCILCAAASAAAVVSFAGLLGFVGLIVPHMARRLVGNQTRMLLLTSAILGGIVTILADLLGRILLAPTEIPVGIMMAVVGVPFFLALLLQRRGHWQ